MSVLLEFSMFPVGQGESLSQHVAGSLEIIDSSGVAYKLNPMGTVLEGQWDEVFEVVRRCYERMSRNCSRIVCTIKVDAREGQDNRLTEKIDSVETKIGRQLKK